MTREKFYVVWKGRTPGVYADWDSCKAQVHGDPQAEFKGYDTRDAAERAWRAPNRAAARALDPPSSQVVLVESGQARPAARIVPVGESRVERAPAVGLAVDAACSGNPGETEYRGVDLASRQVLFHTQVGWGTNNIGEFLAIVHGLAICAERGDGGPIYSDSLLAIGWVNKGRSRSEHVQDPRAERARQLIARAERWLREHPIVIRIHHWQTKLWGEIPADFGRK